MFKIRARHLRVTKYQQYQTLLPFVHTGNPNGIQVMSGKKTRKWLKKARHLVAVEYYEDGLRKGRFNYDPEQYEYRRKQQEELHRAMMQSARVWPRRMSRNIVQRRIEPIDYERLT
jgi:hypothetical protein